jgi:hypothetical protein
MANTISLSGIFGRMSSPLVFFASSVVSTKLMMGDVLISTMPDQYKFLSVCVVAVEFITVVIGMSVITIKCPEHLYNRMTRKSIP